MKERERPLEIEKRKQLFAERLKIICAIKHISGAELASKVGITQQSASYYLRAERMPNLEVVDQICEALDVSPMFMLGYEEP